MELITDYKDWRKTAKRSANPVRNLYLLPDKLQRLAEEKRLYGYRQSDCGIQLLSDEGAYDCLYFCLPHEAPFQPIQRDKPLLAEVVSRAGDRTPQISQMLIKSGFYQRNCCIQLMKNLSEEIIEVPQNNDYHVEQASTKDKDALLKLWETCLDIYDFHDDCKYRLEFLLESGCILCLRDIRGHIQGGVYCDTHGKNCMIRHIAIAPACRGKKLAEMLLQAGENHARGKGCVTSFAWVAEDNAASVALFKKTYTATDRCLLQFIYE